MKAELQIKENFKAGMASLAKGLVKAQTTQDCENIMNDSGLFTTKCELTDIPFTIARQVAGTYFRVFMDFPFLGGRIEGVGVYVGSSTTFAHCHMEDDNNAFGGGAVHLNICHFQNAKKLDKAYRDTLLGTDQKGFHPENTDYKAIITHELGHVVDGYLTGMGLCGKKANGERNRVSAYLRKKSLKHLNMSAEDINSEVSGYARSAAFEWFAECFAEYMNSRTPRNMCLECMHQLRELLRDALQK